MNEACLLLTIASLVLAIKKRVLPFAVCMFFFGFLVVGQSIYIDSVLDEGWISILYNYITADGYFYAQIYLLLSLVVIFTIALAAPAVRPRNVTERQARMQFRPGIRFYVLHMLALLGLYFVLVVTVVGVDEFVSASRPGFQSGSTIFLVLLFSGVMPLLIKLSCGQRPLLADLLLALVAILMTSAFSRVHGLLAVSCIVYAAYYGLDWAFRGYSFKTYVMITIGLVLSVGIFFGVGALRDALNYTNNDLQSLLTYLADNPDKSLLSIEYNYQVGIEGMAGLAGAFTYGFDHPALAWPDGGLSWILRGITQWLPGGVKALMTPYYDFADGLNWYKNSIVAPGIAISYVSFWWAGPLVYGLMFYLSAWLPALYHASGDTPHRLKWMVIRYVAMGMTIFFVRGTWVVWFGYSISYLGLILVLWPIYRMQLKVADESSH